MAYKPKRLKKITLLSNLITLSAVLFGCLLVVALGMVLKDLLRSQNDQKAFQQLAQLVEEQKPQQPQISSPVPSDTPAATEEAIQEPSPYLVLKEKNPDFVAWVNVPGTAIDYPVMHTPENSQYYLYRSFDGADSPSGTPFVGDYGSLEGDRCIIYGHNMKDGTMFRDLLNYDKKAFWEENPTFTIHTLEGEETYDIFSAVSTRILTTNETGLRFYRLPDGIENWLVEQCLYDTGITPQEGDKIVLLSTCSYHTEEGRFLIAGKLRQ